MPSTTFLVYHPSQLNALSALPLARKPGLGKIVLDEKWNHPERVNWEKQLNRHYYACGCDTAAKALLIGAVLCGPIAVYACLEGRIPKSDGLWLGIGGPIVLALFGKLWGRVQTNGRLKKTVREIQSDWKVEWPKQDTSIACG